MTLRRLLVAAPLALLVAYAGHAAGFGTTHALGGAHGPALLAGLVVALALSALVPVLWLAFGKTPRSLAEVIRGLASSLPASGNLPAMAALLAALGGIAFACIELTEGRAPAPTWALAALPLAALAVAALARFALSWLARLGLYIATLGERLPERLSPPTFLAPPAFAPVSASLARGSRRGRAPPRLA
jgi:hypothetical protein